jgi:hypothetical protein
MCTACEMTKCDNPPLTSVHGSQADADHLTNAVATCFKSTDVVANGPLKGMNKLRADACQELLNCIHTSNCVVDASGARNPAACFCGSSTTTPDLISKCNSDPTYPKTGSCQTLIQNASESNVLQDVFDRYQNPAYPLGAAFSLATYCDHDTVKPKTSGICFSACNGPNGSTGGGGSGGSGSAGVSGTAGTGSNGAAGSGGAGDQGSTAGSGSSGAAGSSATAGTTGSAGTGSAGASGSSGADAAAGDNGSAGAAGSTSGTSGTTGTAGDPGSAGSTGGDGAGGMSGSTGTSPLPIPLGGKACTAPVSGAMCPDLDGDTVADCNQTLAMNPGFDTAVTSWNPEDTNAIRLTWVNTGDLNGRASSGGMTVRNAATSDGAPGWNLLGATQCVPISATGSYDFAVQVSIAPGQLGDGGAVAAFTYYQSADCSGAPFGATISNAVTATGSCQILSASPVIPAAVQSVALRLTVAKPISQRWFDVGFDNVLFKKH